MIFRNRILTLAALGAALGPASIAAQDQWLSETSCSDVAHAIVNEGITARNNVEHGRAKGMYQAALVVDPNCIAAKIALADMANGSEWGTRSSQIAALADVSGTPSEMAWLEVINSSNGPNSSYKMAQDMPDDALFHYWGSWSENAGSALDGHMAFAERFPSLAGGSFNTLAYAYAQGDGVDTDEVKAREFLRSYLRLYNEANAHDSFAEISAIFGDYEGAVRHQQHAVDRGGATVFGERAGMYRRLANKDEYRQSVVDAVEVLANPDAPEEETAAVLSDQSVMCLSSMAPCSVMTAAEYMATANGTDWLSMSANDIEVMFNDMMTRAVATHHNTGQYMLDGQTVDYSVRVSSVWEVTNQGVSLITANWAPMGGAGLPSS
jgi:hypothetical protein